MLKTILDRFRKPAKAVAAGPDWLEIDATDLVAHDDLLHRLMTDEIIGVTLRGVFPREACEHAAATIRDHEAIFTPVVFGSVLGRPLLQDGMSPDRRPHLDDAERAWPAYRTLFGFDPHEQIATMLAPILGSLAWSSPTEDGRRYNPGNIRVMEPGGGGLVAHAGNEFLYTTGPGSGSHLLATTDAFDHLSYFVVLQRPEGGGTLSVFDKLWQNPDETGALPQPLGYDHEFDGIAARTIDAAPGDMVLFRAGRRYHRVEPIEGTRPRLTYGGFTAPSRDGAALNCWC